MALQGWLFQVYGSERGGYGNELMSEVVSCTEKGGFCTWQHQATPIFLTLLSLDVQSSTK